MWRWLPIVALAGCGTDDIDVVRADTTGEEFHLHCDAHGFCDVEPVDPDLTPPACAPVGHYGVYVASQRIVSIGGTCNHGDEEFPAWTFEYDLTRPVTCERDGDCEGIATVDLVCQAGLCQWDDWPEIYLGDVWSLCLADVPREDTLDPSNPSQAHLAVQALVEQACPGAGQECQRPLPDGCRQP